MSDTELAEIRRLLEEKISNDRVREKAFDQLYEELRGYKEDFLFQAEKPLLIELLQFYDSLNWFQESLIKQEMSPDVIADSFQYLIDEFMEALYRRDIEVLPPVHKKFDPKRHMAVEVEVTGDPKADQQIKKVLKRGFTRKDKILRPDAVVLYRYEKANDD